MLNYQRVNLNFPMVFLWFSHFLWFTRMQNLLTSRQKIYAKTSGNSTPRGDSPIAQRGLSRANLDHLLKAHGWFKTSRHVKSMYGLMGKSFIGLLEDKIYRIESIFFAHEN